MKKELSPDLEMVACDVCGRTILKGEHTEPYLVPDGSRRLVCDLCVRRAEGAGWLRESVHGDMPAAMPRTEPRRSLLGRLRRRLEERAASAGAGRRPDPGGAYLREGWEPAPDAARYAGAADAPAGHGPPEGLDGELEHAYAEDPDSSYPQPSPAPDRPPEDGPDPPVDVPPGRETESAEGLRPVESVGAEDPDAPGAAAQPEAFESAPPLEEAAPEQPAPEDPLVRDPAQDALATEGEPPVDPRAARRERRQRRRLRDPRHVRAVPTNAEAKVERALEVFNESDYRRTVAGLVRTLGQPWVTALPHGDTTSEVTVVVAWELSWYQFRVDLGDSAEPVAVVDKGHEVEEIDEELRRWNATATEDGALEPGAPAA